MLRAKAAEFASKFAAYACIIVGVSLAISVYRREPLTHAVIAIGTLMAASGIWWLIHLRRRYG
jgi:hypothetical protein